jgi:hypothetical protein
LGKTIAKFISTLFARFSAGKKSSHKVFLQKNSIFDFFSPVASWTLFFVLAIFGKFVEKCQFSLQTGNRSGLDCIISFKRSVDPMKSFFGDLLTSNHQVRQRWRVECTLAMALGPNPFTACTSL